MKEIEFTVQGEKRLLSTLRPSYVLLDLWRPESEACRKLDGPLQELAKSAGDQPFQILSLTYDLPDAAAGRSSEGFGHWTSGVLADRWSDVLQDLGIWSVPRFVIVDPQGKFVMQGDFETVRQKLRELLGD